MVLFYALILALNDGSHIGWQVLLQRAFVGTLCRVFASLALGEHSGIVHPGDRRFDIDPTTASGAGSRAVLVGVTAQSPNLCLQLGHTLGAALCRLFEQRFQLGILDSLGTGAESLFAILARFNELVHRRN